MVIIFDRENLSDDIYEVIFSTRHQIIVGKSLIRFFRENGNELDKTSMSFFVNMLHEGDLETTIDEPPYAGQRVRLTYNRRQFYERILGPFKSMGLIDFDSQSKKYTLSNNFIKDLKKIGVLWHRELAKA